MYRLMGFITGLCTDDIMETINHLLQMQRGIGFGGGDYQLRPNEVGNMQTTPPAKVAQKMETQNYI